MKKCRVCDGVGKVFGFGNVLSTCHNCFGEGSIEEVKSEESVAPRERVVHRKKPGRPKEFKSITCQEEN